MSGRGCSGALDVNLAVAVRRLIGRVRRAFRAPSLGALADREPGGG